MQSNSSKSRRKSTYFEEVLNEAGINLSENDDAHVITQEQALVVRDLEKLLKNQQNHPNSCVEFIDGLKKFCDDDETYKKALLATKLRKSLMETDCGVEQDSLFKLFLNVQSIQTEIIDMLIEQLVIQGSEENGDTAWLRLILNALRYLPFITDSNSFTTKFLDVIEVSTFASQLEFILSIPDIIPDNQYEQASKQLSKLLEENEDLAGAIIDCLNFFNLSTNARLHIQNYIIDRLLNCDRYFKIFPILFEFLITDCKQESFIGVLLKLRNTLDNIMSCDSNDLEIVSNKALIFNKLQSLVRIKRNLFEGITNMLGTIRTSNNHKPIDVLLLILLHSVWKNKKKIIEAIFKRKIKAGLFRLNLIEKLFGNYFAQKIFSDCFDAMIEISGLHLASNELILVEAGSLMFRLLFSNELSLNTHRQDVLYSLTGLMGINESKNAGAVLDIIASVMDDVKLRNHVVQLMRLLKLLENLSLKNVKQLFEILCYLTAGENADEARSGLKDEIHMLIRKQLSVFKKDVKHRGIIAAVVMAKHIATVSGDQSDLSNDSIVNITDLPSGNSQEAASLLELTKKSASGTPEYLGLYYDQLSSMIITGSSLDKHLIAWLSETVTNYFQNEFLPDAIPETMHGIELSSQYELNAVAEISENMSVNIAELVIKPRFVQNSSILVLAPLFRLVRLLHYKQNDGNLSSIDALLGCGVIMPKTDNLETFDPDQLKQVADCVFHCINWFRELISAFVTQRSKNMRTKVMSRLMELVRLEELLARCLECIPEHKLPPSYFDMLTQNLKISPSKTEKLTKPPKKKLKSNPIVNETASSILPTQTKTTKRALKIETNYKFREIDTDVVILLKYPLDLNNEITATPSSTLDIKQFQFILKDFVSKLNILTKQKNVGLLHLNVVEPIKLLTDCVKLIPVINRQNGIILESIKNALEKVDDKYDSTEMFTDEITDLKLGLGLVLEFYSLVFNWSGFQHSKHEKLLIDCLKGLRATELSQSVISIARLIKEFINTLFTYIDQCLYLPSAVSIIEIMQSLHKVLPLPDHQKIMVAASEKLLKKKWFNLQGKSECNKIAHGNVDILIKAYLAEAKVATIYGLVGTLQDQIGNLKSKEDSLAMLESIDKGNFYIFYRGLCHSLAVHVKTEIDSLTNNEHLVLWRTTALTMQGLMTVAKVHESRANLSCFLKKSINIMKTFLSHGIPILEIMLRSKPNEVLEIFKILQTTYRFLHHLCCYYKSVKDAGLMNLVPDFRMTLEKIMYRVKAALVANDCSQAFWMGNLRNRDMHGDDILSQTTSVSSINETVNDEELPSDDSSDEIDDVQHEDTSASEIFETES